MGLFVRIRRDGTVQVAADGEFKSGPPAKHNFAEKWVNRSLISGVASIDGDTLTVGEAEYAIVRRPGAYCCHCGERIADGPALTKDEADLRIAYIATCEIANNDDDTADPNNPAGYEVIGYYQGELV